MPAYDRTLDLRNFLKAVLQLSHIRLGLMAYLHGPIYSISEIVLQKSYGGAICFIISHLTPKKQEIVQNLVCILNLS